MSGSLEDCLPRHLSFLVRRADLPHPIKKGTNKACLVRKGDKAVEMQVSAAPSLLSESTGFNLIAITDDKHIKKRDLIIFFNFNSEF